MNTVKGKKANYLEDTQSCNMFATVCLITIYKFKWVLCTHNLNSTIDKLCPKYAQESRNATLIEKTKVTHCFTCESTTAITGYDLKILLDYFDVPKNIRIASTKYHIGQI